MIIVDAVDLFISLNSCAEDSAFSSVLWLGFRLFIEIGDSEGFMVFWDGCELIGVFDWKCSFRLCLVAVKKVGKGREM